MPLTCWLQDCYRRIFPIGNTPGDATLDLAVARGERLSFQAAVAWDGDPEVVTVKVAADAPAGVAVRVRRVGFVPQAHHNTNVPEEELDCIGHVPGYVPDPLYDECESRVAAGEAVAFWFTVQVEPGCLPGRKSIRVVVERGGKIVKRMRATLQVHSLTLEPRKGFPVVQWFYNDALLDWYRLTAFENAFWPILEAYMRDLPEHGQDTILMPAFTPPTDGVKRPTQLVKVTKAGQKYEFDFADVRRYVRLARKCGITNFEWNHFFTQWGVRNAIRIYHGQGQDEKLLWKPETGATSSTYRNFLKQYLPAFKAFLDREKLMRHSFFHVSDEPHGPEILENYKKARALLKDLAPWMPTMDALSEIVYGRERVTDMPIPSIQVTKQFVDEGIPCMTYFCCGPRGHYLNRLTDTPLIKIRMSGWLFYRFPVLGFLHWGYNYWYKAQTRQLIDPFREQAAGWWPGWAYGDTFVVYPGPAGPLDSIRWEIFGESLQDYAMLQTLGVDPAGELLAPFEDFNKFPKDARWLAEARKRLLAGR